MLVAALLRPFNLVLHNLIWLNGKYDLRCALLSNYIVSGIASTHSDTSSDPCEITASHKPDGGYDCQIGEGADASPSSSGGESALRACLPTLHLGPHSIESTITEPSPVDISVVPPYLFSLVLDLSS